ncbi:hypothetical protein VNO78_11097 [Psophocarpus tetragonolobus]|uniref:Uncharacterized protein n=1 Tax=Psophocarpus tetragonolobus TaxID=3891 RepID=A0AAN9SMI0_PSOTE
MNGFLSIDKFMFLWVEHKGGQCLKALCLNIIIFEDSFIWSPLIGASCTIIWKRFTLKQCFATPPPCIGTTSPRESEHIYIV